MKIIRLLMVISVLGLGGCKAIAEGLGYVPQADLDEAKQQISQLEQELKAANRDTEYFKTQAQNANAALTEAREDLTNEREANAEAMDELLVWQALQCPNHTWTEAWTVQAIFPFQGVLKDFPNADRYVTFTQWSIEPGWVSGRYATTLLWDVDGQMMFVIDTEADCIIINPDFNPEIGR